MVKIQNLEIWVEHSGKRIPVKEVEDNVTAKELLDALAGKISLPAGQNGVLIRKLTRKQLLPTQTMKAARIEDGETLIADFERTAGTRL